MKNVEGFGRIWRMKVAMIKKIRRDKCLCGVDRRLKRDKMTRGIMKCVEMVNGKFLKFILL